MPPPPPPVPSWTLDKPSPGRPDEMIVRDRRGRIVAYVPLESGAAVTPFQIVTAPEVLTMLQRLIWYLDGSVGQDLSLYIPKVMAEARALVTLAKGES